MPDDAAPVEPPAALSDSLTYLLKQAQMRLHELTTAGLAPLGITGRELAVLRVVSSAPPPSQQEIAALMGVDRTTMVNLIDELQRKGLLVRRQSPQDRRKNTVVLTDAGHERLEKGAQAVGRAEADFLAPLAKADPAAFRAHLRAVALAVRPAGTAGQQDPPRTLA